MEKVLFSSGCSKVVRDSTPWESGNDFNKFDKDYPYGYPWPPRYYTCSFCQREFKSAQALGGHMNIHRRDRARLRDQDQSPNPNSDHPQNPNPTSYHNPTTTTNNNNTNNNISPSTSPTNNNNIYAHQYSLVSLSLSSLPPSSKHGEKRGDHDHDHGFERAFQGVHGRKWRDLHHDDDGHEVRVLKSATNYSNKQVVKLDLELCLGEAKEDLDLELRLGI